MNVRLKEIKSRIKVEWEFFGRQGKFEHTGLVIRNADILLLTDLLMQQPCALGWGSGKPVVDALLRGEGKEVPASEYMANIERMEGDARRRRERVVEATGDETVKAVPYQDIQKHLPVELRDIVFDSKALFWESKGEYYYDDPEFGPVCRITSLAYNDEIGLHSID